MGNFWKKWTGAFLSLALLWTLTGSCRGAETKYLALTFDDGPSGQFTERLLEGLSRRGAKATFFLCGYRVEIFPELPEKILAGGHEIGLHGYSHDPMDQMSEAVLERELDRTAEILYEATGRRFSLLRPPGGCSTDRVQEAARDRNLSLIFWSVDPRDWATEDRAAIASRVEEKARQLRGRGPFPGGRADGPGISICDGVGAGGIQGDFPDSRRLLLRNPEVLIFPGAGESIGLRVPVLTGRQKPSPIHK